MLGTLKGEDALAVRPRNDDGIDSAAADRCECFLCLLQPRSQTLDIRRPGQTQFWFPGRHGDEPFGLDAARSAGSRMRVVDCMSPTSRFTGSGSFRISVGAAMTCSSLAS